VFEAVDHYHGQVRVTRCNPPEILQKGTTVIILEIFFEESIGYKWSILTQTTPIT
jgi:hypothetical protein